MLQHMGSLGVAGLRQCQGHRSREGWKAKAAAASDAFWGQIHF